MQTEKEIEKKCWFITGVAGFIGSNLLETLLLDGATVRGIDDFSTGKRRNLADVKANVGDDRWKNFTLIEGDICDQIIIADAMIGVDYVLHHAAYISAPNSINEPVKANRINVEGFVNVVDAALKSGVRSIVYASSSAVYGNSDAEINQEETTGEMISPYAVSKRVNELYAGYFSGKYKVPITGLRYFNVYGKRQDPNGQYAAVIPKWIDLMFDGDPVIIYGDGSSTRDYCSVKDVVRANIAAATAKPSTNLAPVYNVATGSSVDLDGLYAALKKGMDSNGITALPPRYLDWREGDVRDSVADVMKIGEELGFTANVSLEEGVADLIDWAIKYKGKST